jgi:O-antigen biosynthesis protein
MTAAMNSRVRVRGKFLFVGDEKLSLRAVTYGTFRPTADGEYGTPGTVARDFARMAAHGINAVRTYSAPPRWLLDSALRHGLFVLVGLAWEQHVAFLEDGERPRAILARVRADVRACAGHPAVLGYTIGNEIPAAIVRWHGRHRIERFLERLYKAVKAEDPGALATYANYPSTEYLQLPFLDFVAFNVYLESEERLSAYLARLQNIAGDRPLVISEIGLDSARNGLPAQALAIETQVRAAFAAGCAGAVVFKWTDEWYRGGEVTDWDFGMTDRARAAKPALAALARAFADAPFPAGSPCPRFSVIVCSHNGARTLRDCCAGLRALAYPDVEVILVDDGSTDETAAIAASHGFRVIRIPNGGLSHARNVGLAAATGDFVAYIDDDAWPDPDWLAYLHLTFLATDHVGVGGPNIAPIDDDFIAHAVAHAPGGPIHVLLSDQEAEHIPGCNMAFRRAALEEIGGFDPQFRVAGDDVDVCWRLQQRGGTLGFSPAAVVWHRRRDTVRRYWRQQVAYGKAEALLERKWPEKYNVAGHLTWAGRMYGAKLTYLLRRIGRIYQGTWGSALFQSLDQPTPSVLSALPQIPEWYMGIGALAAVAALGVRWPLFSLVAVPLLACTVIVTAAYAAIGATQSLGVSPGSGASRRLWGVTTLLFLLQPLARLTGRVRYGLTPWRNRARAYGSLLIWDTYVLWNEEWRTADAWLRLVETRLAQLGSRFRRGGDYDRWDLCISGGMFGSSLTRMVIEEHGEGKQLVRFRASPRCSPLAIACVIGCIFLNALTVAYATPRAELAVAGFSLILVSRLLWDLAMAAGTFRMSVRHLAAAERPSDTLHPADPLAFSRSQLSVPYNDSIMTGAELRTRPSAVEGD